MFGETVISQLNDTGLVPNAASEVTYAYGIFEKNYFSEQMYWIITLKIVIISEQSESHQPGQEYAVNSSALTVWDSNLPAQVRLCQTFYFKIVPLAHPFTFTVPSDCSILKLTTTRVPFFCFFLSTMAARMVICCFW